MFRISLVHVILAYIYRVTYSSFIYYSIGSVVFIIVYIGSVIIAYNTEVPKHKNAKLILQKTVSNIKYIKVLNLSLFFTFADIILNNDSRQSRL